MYAEQDPYRELYHAILSYDGSGLYEDVVRPWVRAQDGERQWLDSFARRRGEPIPAAAMEELFRLYALSRIVDLLQLGLVPAGSVDVNGWGTKPVRREERAEFMESLGMQPIAPSAFHPFFHEIVTVRQLEDEAAPVEVVEEYWPGYMLGPLLMTRAGCAVAAGRAHLKKEIAERSTLYWAYARRTRPNADLSQGWGSNSSWRTLFRRDYALGGVLHYNVDPAHRTKDDDLTPAEQLELLRHRCFVQCTKPHEDRWPYGYSHREEGTRVP